MNLNNPNLNDLKHLIAACKDKNDHHILWICNAGKVHIDRLPANMAPEEFERQTPNMQIRLRTYHRGKGYVGKTAAADDNFVKRLYGCLLEQWQAARNSANVRYIDQYC